MMGRRLAAVVTLALAAAGATLAPQPAHARACGNECIYYQGYTGNPGWFRAKWVTNDNGWYIRGVANCGDGRQTILETGGWVTTTGLYSKAACPSSLPVLIGGAYDVKHCASCSYTRTVKYGHMNPRRRP